jgi:hypothetical protein
MARPILSAQERGNAWRSELIRFRIQSPNGYPNRFIIQLVYFLPPQRQCSSSLSRDDLNKSSGTARRRGLLKVDNSYVARIDGVGHLSFSSLAELKKG